MTATTARRCYGYRIDRCRQVYAYLAAPVRGRCPECNQEWIGNLTKVLGGWRNDLCCDVWETADAAADSLIRITFP